MATATPVIATHFGALDDVAWVSASASRINIKYLTAYLITMYLLSERATHKRTAFLPTFGKIYKIFSIKLTFIIGLMIFEST